MHRLNNLGVSFRLFSLSFGFKRRPPSNFQWKDVGWLLAAGWSEPYNHGPGLLVALDYCGPDNHADIPANRRN